MKINYTDEYKMLLDAIEKEGENSSPFKDTNYGHIMIDGNKVVAKNPVPGVEILTEEIPNGVKVIVNVKPNTHVANPIHMCFGLLPEKGTQYINSTYNIGKNARVAFLAHCIFPNAVDIVHKMDAIINIEENAKMQYDEIHFHGEKSGIKTIPKTIVNIGKKGVFKTLFKLVQGSVGILDIDMQANVAENGICDLTSKVYGKNNDNIKIKECIYLNEKNSRGIAKTRVVVKDKAYTEFYGEVVGSAEGARGHIDCNEIMDGNESVAISFPVVKVTHSKAKVTHEAAIGSIDRDQIETLMARGLKEDDAIEVVVKGMLR